MDYEDKYKKALKEARVWYGQLRETGRNDYANELEHIFEELKECEGERMRKAIICLLQEFYEQTSAFYKGESVKDMLAWLEKQGKQNPTDEFKPKFNVGDWVVYCNEDIDLITDIEENGYCINNGGYIPFVCESDIRLWTINDARKGNVLVHNNCTFIYMGIKDGIVQAIEENMLEPVNFGEPDKDNDYHPATKEQRNTLFAKIKEKGYEWNKDTLELKQI